MEAEDYKRQINFNILAITDGEYKADIKKELSNLIFNVQQYCKKGGKEDLW